MGKKRKSKRKNNGTCAKAGNALSVFEKRMKAVLHKMLGDDFPMHLFTKRELEHMQMLVHHIKAARRFGNSMVSKAELKQVDRLYQQLLRKENISLDGKKVSLFELNVFSVYLFFIQKEIKSEHRRKKLIEFAGPEYEYDCEAYENLFHAHNNMVFIKVISSLTDVSKKIFCLSLRKDGACMAEYIPEVTAFLPIKKSISINGIRRPIYKVGLPSNANVHKWAKINSSLLGDHYNGEKKELDVYIQAHALKRMEERLDAMGAFSRNFMLTITFPHLKSLESYRGYLLIPIEPGGVRVGYLFCNVIDDMLVVRTFLFITHSATPEGDRLKEFTGMNRSDISYWKIDRLSTLFKIDKEHWPELIRMFEVVGIKNIQSLNIDGFNDGMENEDGQIDSFISGLNDMNYNLVKK